jgi:hypothetical protein
MPPNEGSAARDWRHSLQADASECCMDLQRTLPFQRVSIHRFLDIAPLGVARNYPQR